MFTRELLADAAGVVCLAAMFYGALHLPLLF